MRESLKREESEERESQNRERRVRESHERESQERRERRERESQNRCGQATQLSTLCICAFIKRCHKYAGVLQVVKLWKNPRKLLLLPRY